MGAPSFFRRLISGLDTVEAAYYLRPSLVSPFQFEPLMIGKERVRANKSRDGVLVQLGALQFTLQGYGSKSGYPLVLEHPDFTIQCGEFNNPGFFVTYRSEALWRQGAAALHENFLTWAQSVGLSAWRSESLSRVDFTFDYWLAAADFGLDSLVTLAAKDSQHREDRKLQTIDFGKGDIRLRIYDKSAEILQKSQKFWFYQLWGTEENVWRVEWQVRKEVLKRFRLRSFEDLFVGRGDVLRYLAVEHDSLRIPGNDSNRSRWPLHPLWEDLQAQIAAFPCQGAYREINEAASIHRQLQRIAVSIYGYKKRVAALMALAEGRRWFPWVRRRSICKSLSSIFTTR